MNKFVKYQTLNNISFSFLYNIFTTSLIVVSVLIYPFISLIAISFILKTYYYSIYYYIAYNLYIDSSQCNNSLFFVRDMLLIYLH